MNNFFALTAFALILGTTSASAFELGNGFAWDTTATATYSVETETLATVVDTELNYTIVEGATVYLSTSFYLEDPQFTVATLGVDWAVAQVSGLEVGAWADFDDNADYVDATIEVSFSF